jgi:hypothetical protein
MAKREIDIIWQGGLEKLVIDDADLRQMTAVELAAREDRFTRRLGKCPFADKEENWLDCEYIAGMRHHIGSCARILERIK